MADKIIIFTNSFKVYGTLYKGDNKEKDILSKGLPKATFLIT